METKTNSLNAAQMVTAALLGYDQKAVSVGGKVYVIPAPTIKRIAGAGYYLSKDLSDGVSLKDVLQKLSQAESLCKALSWFIQGDEGLAEELSNGKYEEIVHGIEVAYSLISIENFIKLSALRKSVAKMIAKPRL
ncbi:MAG: hypothetical protein K6G73_12425 [Marinilabiliaceae bacterium]|nr:hypothetical protein [Marinilabiliaceae bacterium]